MAVYEEEMAELVQYVKIKSEYFGLYINPTKTKIIITDRSKGLSFLEALQDFEKVQSFLYFGALLEANDGILGESRWRVALSRAIMNDSTIHCYL